MRIQIGVIAVLSGVLSMKSLAGQAIMDRSVFSSPESSMCAGCMEIIVEHYLTCNFLSFFTPADDAIVEWHFGDGTVVVDGPSVEYAYPNDGNYTVTAYVTAPGCPEGIVVTEDVFIDCGNSVPEDNRVSFTFGPNPTEGPITLRRSEAGACEMMVFDVAGSLLHRETITSAVHQTYLLNLNAGIYFILIGGESRRVVVYK